jgi:hypothetical protein
VGYGAFFCFARETKKPGFPLQVLGIAHAIPVGFPLQSLAQAACFEERNHHEVEEVRIKEEKRGFALLLRLL